MNEETKNYELTFLLSSEVDYNEVIKTIRANHIEIKSESQPAKIKLAYPIKKENFAYFGNLYFSADSQAVEALNKVLRGDSKILRFFIFNKPVIKKTESRKMERASRHAAESEKISERVFRPSAPEKSGNLTNEALEKRLEEILK